MPTFNWPLPEALSDLDGSPGDVVYSPEREQLYWWRGDRVLVWDMRADQWAVWVAPDDLSLGETGAVVAGVLWVCPQEPAKLTRTDGHDLVAETAHPVSMALEVANINIGGPLRWGRVRSLSVFGDKPADPHELNQSVTFDDEVTHDADPVVLPAPPETTWPTSRYAPEWRLPTQKCSAIAVSVSATPATAVWSALVLDVFVHGTGRAPAHSRQ